MAAARRWATYTILAAFCGLTPAIVHLLRCPSQAGGIDVGVWVYVLMLAGGLQAAYAVYVLQLPDWSTVWVAALVALFLATGYAMFAGISLLAHEQSRIIQGLGLTHEVRGHSIAGWCLMMLVINGLLAYSGGRLSAGWQRQRTSASGLRTRAGSAP